MAILTFNDDSLKRGKVSLGEAKEALDDSLVIEAKQEESEQGNPTVMYVGKTHTEKILEVGVEYKPDETHVYHARKANARLRKLYDNP